MLAYHSSGISWLVPSMIGNKKTPLFLGINP
jgi:hypothetical protein